MELKEIMAGLKKLEPTLGRFEGLLIRPDGDATATFQEYPLGFDTIEELEALVWGLNKRPDATLSGLGNLLTTQTQGSSPGNKEASNPGLSDAIPLGLPKCGCGGTHGDAPPNCPNERL